MVRRSFQEFSSVVDRIRHHDDAKYHAVVSGLGTHLGSRCEILRRDWWFCQLSAGRSKEMAAAKRAAIGQLR